MELTLHGRSPRSVFGLNGDDENSATCALGWTLTRSPVLLAALGEDLVGEPIKPDAAPLVGLQCAGADRGFTDVEIVTQTGQHIIVEAKRGWTLPRKEQLEKYVARICRENRRSGLLVSLSAASQKYAASKLPRDVGGIRLVHRSWADLSGVVGSAQTRARRFDEKLWLRELKNHLEEYVLMQKPRDNTVYVVSLSKGQIKKGYTWVDVVEKDKSYFHPLDKQWPCIPPNYIGFRWDGQLQSVHHIKSHEVVSNLSKKNRRWPNKNQDHFVYRLGPAMQPPKKITAGRIQRAGRVKCAIDTLLSGEFETLSGAVDETKRRLKAAGG